MNRLYYNQDEAEQSPDSDFQFSTFNFQFSTEVLEQLLRRIYQKEFDTATEIDRAAWREFWRLFNQAADEGYGVRSYNERDYDFYRALRYNNGVFAAFRTHRFQNDIARQLLDEEGKLKSFERFAYDIRTLIAPTHLRAWLQTEYATAVIRARQTAQWQRFEANRDILPNLRWVPSTSLDPGLDHQVFWNTVRPVDDPFWSKHRPGDRWNCKCDLEATDEEPTEVPESSDNDRPSPGLDNNPADDAKLFNDSHPYVRNAYPGAKEAVERLMVGEGIRDIINHLENGYPKGDAIKIGGLTDGVKKFVRNKDIELQTDEIYMTDKQIHHALRTVKQRAGKAVTAEQLIAFPLLMEDCEVYWDDKAGNIQFITRQDGKVQKFVVGLNYLTKIQGEKKTVNAFITAGILEERNLGMKNLIKIK